MADAKLGISEKGHFHYPDIMVTCDERDRRAIELIQYPCLVVEVLSPGTEAYNRGDKFKHYRRLKSLKEYVLISADKMNVECYRINERGKWKLTAYSVEKTEEIEPEIYLNSVDFCCPIFLLYEDVTFPKETYES
jgi:Uma2 family endonuclease